jgi:hypothetical protein
MGGKILAPGFQSMRGLSVENTIRLVLILGYNLGMNLRNRSSCFPPPPALLVILAQAISQAPPFSFPGTLTHSPGLIASAWGGGRGSAGGASMRWRERLRRE